MSSIVAYYPAMNPIRGSGWLERAARVVGWLGVLGLVLLRRRPGE